MSQSEKLEALFQYFSKELVQEALAGAISGAAVETGNQLLKNGFNLKKFEWKDVMKSSVVGTIGGGAKQGMKMFNRGAGL